MPTNVRPTLKEVEATASKEYTNLWGTLRKRRSRLEKAGKCTEAEAVSLQISQLPDREAFCQTALEKYRAQYREQYKHRKNPKTDRFATPGSPAPPSPVSTPATAAAAGLPLRSPPPNYNQLLPPSVARASPEVILQYLDSLTMTSLARGNDNVAIAIGTHFARRSAPPSPAPACNAPMMYPLSPSPGLLPALNAGTPNAWAPSVGAPNAGALNGAWTPRPPPVPKKFGRKTPTVNPPPYILPFHLEDWSKDKDVETLWHDFITTLEGFHREGDTDSVWQLFYRFLGFLLVEETSAWDHVFAPESKCSVQYALTYVNVTNGKELKADVMGYLAQIRFQGQVCQVARA